MSARILLFDLYTGGHHRHYLEMLARAWVAGDRPGLLEIAAPERLFEDHSDFRTWLAAQDPERVGVIPIVLPNALGEGSSGLFSVLSNDMVHGRVLSQLLRDRRPDHVLAMYFDHVQASLTLRRIPARQRSKISGIYFRPSFHFKEESPVTRFRKRRLLQAALSHPSIHRLLTLDPFVVEFLDDPRVVWLPDGFDPTPPSVAPDAVRSRWQVEPSRRVLLFFGVVSERKGIMQVLRALPKIQGPKTALILAGRIPLSELPAVKTAIEEARARSDVQILHDDRYVPEEEIQDMFRAADAAVVAYQRHTGSSSVLIRAAAEATPVIGQDYGLMGRLIEEHRLGLAVDTTDSVALAQALSDGARGLLNFDADASGAFAARNTARRFTETVFRQLLSEETDA